MIHKDNFQSVLFVVTALFLCACNCIYLYQSGPIKQPSFLQTFLHTPAGPAQCSLTSGTPSGHRSAGTRVKGQQNSEGEKCYPNLFEAVAVFIKPKKKKKIQPQY